MITFNDLSADIRRILQQAEKTLNGFKYDSNKLNYIVTKIDQISRKLIKAGGVICLKLFSLADVGGSEDYTDGNTLRANGTEFVSARLEAEDIDTDTTNFDGNLSVSDDTVQKALETLDDHSHDYSTLTTAGQTISALKVLTIDTTTGKAIYADKDTSGHCNRILGVSYTSGLINESITVITKGEMTDNSWAWDLTKPVFLGSNGVLTQTSPTTGFRVIIGFPISATMLNIQISEGIIKS